ncbi:MAG: hypothetical protein V1897_12050 [Pseudomonadota bacterium]
MKKTISTSFKALAVILPAISMTLLFLAVLYMIAQILLASAGWHGMASVSWNG